MATLRPKRTASSMSPASATSGLDWNGNRKAGPEPGLVTGMTAGVDSSNPLLAILRAADSLNDESYMLVRPDGSQVHFNITRARRFVERKAAAMGQGPGWFSPASLSITVDDLRRQYLDLNEIYALHTLTAEDLRRPLLFGSFEGHTDLLDGWHRLFRAISDGRDRLLCYVLTQEEAEQFVFLRFPPGEGIDTEVFAREHRRADTDTGKTDGRGLRKETPPESV